jgi:CubicO group peptidase (beta-lactamase class C family)
MRASCCFAALACVSAFLVVQSTGAQSKYSRLAEQIDAIVMPAAKADIVSGVILIADGAGVAYERAYGFSNWELRTPNTLQTRFGIASITKLFTETLIDILVRDGGLALDTPVEKFLPGFPRGPAGGVPTVRHLLTHRSGVPHRVTTAVEETQILTPADIVERVRTAGLKFEPGSQRLYSSAGFTCLARVVEIVEQQRFDDVLAARVFKVAGMIDATSDPAHDLLPRRAGSYRLGMNGGRVAVANVPYKHLSFLTGAGSVYATAHDLLRFRLAARSGRLPISSPARARAPQEWDAAAGRTNGYEAFFDSLDAAGLTFIFLNNLQSTANWQIQEQVRNVLQNKPTRPLVLPPPIGRANEPPHSLVGRYGSSDAPVEITLDAGHLFRGENEFYATDNGDYYIPASGTTMHFRRGNDGRIDAIISVGGSGQKSVLRRLADAQQPASRH